jgi:hypothetical protein
MDGGGVAEAPKFVGVREDKEPRECRGIDLQILLVAFAGCTPNLLIKG